MPKIPRSGITLLEMIIAMTVFSIGILGVLSIITYNASTIKKVEDSMLTSILAKNGLEIVFHVRDKNIHNLLPWYCITPSQDSITDLVDIADLYDDGSNLAIDFGCSESFLMSGYVYLIDGDVQSMYRIQPRLNNASSGFLDMWNMSQLYIYPKNISYTSSKQTQEEMYIEMYAHTGFTNISGLSTPFARYIEVTPLETMTGVIEPYSIVRVRSHILTSRGGNTGSYMLETFIGKSQ